MCACMGGRGGRPGQCAAVLSVSKAHSGQKNVRNFMENSGMSAGDSLGHMLQPTGPCYSL